MAEELVAIAQLTAPHGVQGQLRAVPLTDFPERLRTLRVALLGDPPRQVGVRFAGEVRGLPLVSIDGVTDRDAADKLRGQYLRLPKGELFPLPPGHFYVFDLIGLAVVDPDGTALGRLHDVERGSAADLYVVRLPDGKLARIPAVKAFVERIDLEGGRIVVRPIPGLLE